MAKINHVLSGRWLNMFIMCLSHLAILTKVVINVSNKKINSL